MRLHKCVSILPALLGVFVLGAPSSSVLAQTATISARLREPVDESSLTVLKGNRHPLAIPSNDRGEVRPDLPMERMVLVLKRDPGRESALERLVREQQDKYSQRRFRRRFIPRSTGTPSAVRFIMQMLQIHKSLRPSRRQSRE